MKITEVKIMRGPSYWSTEHHRLVCLTLDTGAYSGLSAGEIDGFYKRLTALIPSVKQSICPDEIPEGICAPVTEKNSIAEVVARVALELQNLAGMNCIFGKTHSEDTPGSVRVIFCYLLENAGRYAGKTAVDIVKALILNRSVKTRLAKAVEYLAAIYEDEAIGPSTQSIIDEAVSRGIPAFRLDEQSSLIMLGQGKHRKLFQATVMDTTSNIAVETVSSKSMTKRLLKENGIPVPYGVVVENKKEMDKAIETVDYPIVVKPIDGNHGRGITANILKREDAMKAFATAQKISDRVIVENYIDGDDYRFLVINYKLIAVAMRTPAHVVGDGVSTIQQLIENVNADPNRGAGHEKILTEIKPNRHTIGVLEKQGLTLESVVAEGEIVPLKKTANLSTGGTSTDVTDKVHPYNVFMAERIARIVNLDICGIDIVAKDITIPINGSNGAIIEVNAGPGFRMHTHPFKGKPRNVAKPVIDMLFKDNEYSRIPIVAVTGTNGKTTTVRLIAAIAQHAGYSPGFTTTEGIYIDGHIAMRGDCSGPQSAKVVLSDPLVDFAVLECARGGILRSGLAFDKCNISIVTNVTEDHLGLDGINTMEEYAKVKEVLPKSTFEDGYTILNAEDERVLAMKDNLKCNVVLFSTNAENPGIMSHCDSGGITVTIENGNYTICEGKKKWIVMPVNDIPLTFEGTAGFMVQNILPAIAAAYLSGFGIDAIRDALASFTPSPELTPGRMNVFDFGNFKLMLDYAHNAGAFVEIEKYMSGVDAKRKVCIIAATGDRRDDDIRNLGNYAARIFDEIIIRHDKDSRGQNNDRLTELLMEGIRKDGQEKQVTVISDEYEAISYAVEHAQPGTFIFVCADKVWDSIDMIRELQAAFL